MTDQLVCLMRNNTGNTTCQRGPPVAVPVTGSMIDVLGVAWCNHGRSNALLGSI